MRFVILSAVLAGCGAHVEVSEPADASRPDTSAVDTSVADTFSDVRIGRDAFDALDARDPRWPVTREQADCLGFSDTPTCVACHLREGVIYLYPPGAPPPPADHPAFPPELYAKCGVSRP